MVTLAHLPGRCCFRKAQHTHKCWGGWNLTLTGVCWKGVSRATYDKEVSLRNCSAFRWFEFSNSRENPASACCYYVINEWVHDLEEMTLSNNVAIYYSAYKSWHFELRHFLHNTNINWGCPTTFWLLLKAKTCVSQRSEELIRKSIFILANTSKSRGHCLNTLSQCGLTNTLNSRRLIYSTGSSLWICLCATPNNFNLMTFFLSLCFLANVCPSSCLSVKALWSSFTLLFMSGSLPMEARGQTILENNRWRMAGRYDNPSSGQTTALFLLSCVVHFISVQ